jgi:hypothetical protein
LILIATFAVSLIALPTTQSHTPAWNYDTFTYLTVSPNPVGVSQDALVVAWLNWWPPTADNYGWGGRWTFDITITKPDNTTETRTIMSDAVGAAAFVYVPNQEGNYTFVAHHPKQTITWDLGLGLRPGTTQSQYNQAYLNDTFGESTSEPFVLTVQAEPVQAWVESPLPTEYWTRPVNSMSRDWWPILGNWLGTSSGAQYYPTGSYGTTNNYAYGSGPESGHVLWTTPFWVGGAVDARFESAQGFWIGKEYQAFSQPSVIVDGKIYCQRNINTWSANAGVYVYDLATGEELTDLWRAGTLSFASLMNHHSMNVHGVFPYLWSISGTTWTAYDPYSNKAIFNITNVPSSGTTVTGKDGSILRYTIVNLGNATHPNRYLQIWNSTRAVLFGASDPFGNFVAEDSQFGLARGNANVNGANGYSLNVSIPNVSGSIMSIIEGESVIGGVTGITSSDSNPVGLGTSQTANGHLWTISLKKGSEGTLSGNVTFTPPSTTPGNLTMTFDKVYDEYNRFFIRNKDLRTWYAYDLTTGQQVWHSEPEAQWNFHMMGSVLYNGMLITYGIGGEVNAYNVTNGNVLWKYVAKGIATESPYGNYPLVYGCMADGKLYFTSSEHSPNQPFWRGAMIRCINATDGTEIFSVPFWADAYVAPSNLIISDGILVGLNAYDMQLYAFGKGQSSTTVTASPKTSVNGNSVLVEGTVMDNSPGYARSTELSMRFPNGVTAVSDESQSDWMAYVWMNQIQPSNAKGVEVLLSVIDPNNNYYEVGTTTSDASGSYSCVFTPEVPGKYTILATFAGSKSYYGSYAETAIQVDNAPEPAAQPQTLVQADYTMTIIGTGLAVIIAVAIVGAILMLKKRP